MIRATPDPGSADQAATGDFGSTGLLRASFGLGITATDIDRLVTALTELGARH